MFTALGDMMNNVFEFRKPLGLEPDEDKYHAVEGFKTTGEDFLLMDHGMQLDRLKTKCWHQRGGSDASGILVYRLLSVIERVMMGVVLRLDETIGFAVEVNEADKDCYRVGATIMLLKDMRAAVKSGDSSDVKSCEIIVYYLNLSEESQSKTLRSEITGVEDFPSEFFKAKKLPYPKVETLINNINQLASENDGFAKLANSHYVAALPYSETRCIMITLEVN